MALCYGGAQSGPYSDCLLIVDRVQHEALPTCPGQQVLFEYYIGNVSFSFFGV